MSNADKEKSYDLGLPVLFGRQADDKGRKVTTLFVCLVCKKGSFVHTRYPERDFDLSDRDLLKRHKDCLVSFPHHKAYFETKDGHVPTMLPHACLKASVSEEEEVEDKGKKEKPALEIVKAPLEIAEANLRLREQIKKYEESSEEPCIRLKAEVRSSIQAYLYGPTPPEEPEEDEEMVKTLLTVSRKRNIRTAILDKRISEYEEKIQKMEDIFRVLFDNEEVRSRVLRHRLLTEENMKIVQKITGLLDDD
jgi:hypothetical protein